MALRLQELVWPQVLRKSQRLYCSHSVNSKPWSYQRARAHESNILSYYRDISKTLTSGFLWPLAL